MSEREYERDSNGRFGLSSTAEAHWATQNAHAASSRTTFTQNVRTHAAAGDAHRNAAKQHTEAAEVTKETDPNTSAEHTAAASDHKGSANLHYAAAFLAGLAGRFEAPQGFIRKSIPADGLRFAAAVTMGSATTSRLESKPITIVASSGGEAYQGYWGKCINDMSGFTAPSGPVPLDKNHDTKDVIGVADSMEIINGKLVANGRLVPFKEDDSASEIIHKGQSGVPYQASVVLDLATLVAEEVGEGETRQVNGSDFTGPGFVFTKWSINGIAILPYGADAKTSVQFARDSADVEVLVKGCPMPETKIETAVVPVATVAPVANSDSFSRKDVLKFKTDFGQKGVDWYFENKSYEEAAKMFSADIQSQLEAAKAELAAKSAELVTVTTERDAFKAKSEFKRGQAAPVPVKPNDGTTEDPEKKINFNRSEGAQKLVDAIAARMPKQA